MFFYYSYLDLFQFNSLYTFDRNCYFQFRSVQSSVSGLPLLGIARSGTVHDLTHVTTLYQDLSVARRWAEVRYWHRGCSDSGVKFKIMRDNNIVQFIIITSQVLPSIKMDRSASRRLHFSLSLEMSFISRFTSSSRGLWRG